SIPTGHVLAFLQPQAALCRRILKDPNGAYIEYAPFANLNKPKQMAVFTKKDRVVSNEYEYPGRERFRLALEMTKRCHSEEPQATWESRCQKPVCRNKKEILTSDVKSSSE
ncbi:MAG: hypothetical protein K2O07_00800, partial [Alistipes sp.]|nr:hypothetical protein [Alistipes sp.]